MISEVSGRDNAIENVSHVIEQDNEKEVKFEELSSKEKGNRFEEYVVKEISKLESSDIEFLDWQGDHYISKEDSPTNSHIYPLSSSNPDLVYRIKSSGKKIAIECKWRKEWAWRKKWGEQSDFQRKKDWFEIANDSHKGRKMAQYQTFDKSGEDIETYFAIGVGWDDEKNKPDVDEIIPLSAINKELAGTTKEHLKKFKKSYEEIFKST